MAAVTPPWRDRLRPQRIWLAAGGLVLLAGLAIGWLLGARGGDRATPEGDRPPRVVFLAPANAPNLILADPAIGEQVALTAAEQGVEDFAVSPDGTQVAYTQNNPDGTADIWLLDLAGGEPRPLTRCVDARCSAPAWKPDGTQIAYQRQEARAGPSTAPWAWIVDVSTARSRLLFDDAQIHGAGPVWSPDGRRVAVFDATLPGIRIHDSATGDDTVIENPQETAGAFAPDGTRLVYPVLARGALGQEFYTHLELADLERLTITRLSGEADAPVDDAFAAWSPDGTRLAVARRYLDERYTPGKQIVLLDVATGAVTPLVVDPAYNHTGMHWDPSGRWIVFQRFALAEEAARPSVWIVDTMTGARTQVAADAFLPAWAAATPHP